MAINGNRPLQPSGFDKNSISDINKVTKKAIEAVADKIHDADGDNTQFSDVKAAFQELSTQEKVAFSAGTALTGGALAAVSLIGEEVAETGKEVGKAVQKQVKEKYKKPPEAPIIDTLKNAFEDVADRVEEFVDDVKDGRIARDVNKNVKRFHRDNFTEQSKLDKIKNKISDAAEDAAHAAADLADDIADGRVGHNIEKKVKRAFD